MRVEGVTFLDHTADVGIEVEGASLELLFHRAALGMLALLHGQDDPDEEASTAPPAPRPRPAPGAPGSGRDPMVVNGEASGLEMVLAAWLRELLFLHDQGRDYVAADFQRLDDGGFGAEVRTAPAGRAVREIKGVTYHELAVEETAVGWKGRVIFDV